MPKLSRMGASRREFLGRVGQASLLAAGARTIRAADADKPLTVAVVLTEFTYRSHAHVIVENFLSPYLFNGKVIDPGMKLASMYVDQFPAGDMARQVAREHDVTIYPTIAQALTLGNDKLAVDAVLSIGEHGKYPVNALGQVEYPRKRFFDEIVKVFEHSGRVAPLFNDKHLSYRWDWAKEMHDTARRLKIPFLAGSSVPLAERRPPMEIKPGAKITEAVSIHGGGVESYDFHALEVLQSFVEFRAGGETGVKSVQFLIGENLWKAADRGDWSPALAQSALAAELGADHELTVALGRRGKTPRDTSIPAHGILLRYVDGLKAIALKVGDSGSRWCFACKLADEATPKATSIYNGPWNNRNLFKALSHAIQTHFRQREAPYPVERTLLTTGIVAATMESRHAGEKPLDTPHFAIAYQPRDFKAMREYGASWKLITPDTPEPPGLHRLPPESPKN